MTTAPNQQDDGGHAFPWGEHVTRMGGLSMRDYFAAKALNGMLSNDSDDEFYSADFSEVTRRYAQMAYQYADAMLRARQENPNG